MHVELVNMTGEDALLRRADGTTLLLPPPDGVRADAALRLSPADSVCGVPLRVVRSGPGDVVGLPPPVEGLLYVVSERVARLAAEGGRGDVAFAANRHLYAYPPAGRAAAGRG
jgi:hypothetical protein